MAKLYGIQELHNPGPEATLDVVAVHGLGGTATGTWSAGSTCWLSDAKLLPKYLPQARILAYGYNADVFGPNASSDGILQHAQTLVAELNADREFEGANKRPIIWFAHSLGGIVVKRALNYAASRTSPQLEHLHRIFVSTHSIVFFGTPHLGSSKAALLSTLTKLTALTIPKKVLSSSSSLASALQQNSETLQNINDHFSPLMPRFRIFFLWEQLPLDLKYTKEYIVEEASAAPMLTGEVERAGIAADHCEMCRFTSAKQQGFRLVVAACKRYAAQAPDRIAERHRQAEEAASVSRLAEARDLIRSQAGL